MLAYRACKNLLKFKSRSKFKKIALYNLIVEIEALYDNDSELRKEYLELQEVYNVFDNNMNGFLYDIELRETFKKYKIKVSDEQINEILKEVAL